MRPAPRLFLLAAASTSVALAGPAERQAARDRAAKAEQAGLPKSAADALAGVYADALRDAAWAEAIEALYKEINYTQQAGGLDDPAAHTITRLESALTSAPEPVRPVLRTLLAHAYRGYLEAHAHELHDRTAVAASARKTALATGPVPVAERDAARLARDTDEAYRAALADEAALRATPLATYSRLLNPGNLPATRRPTLFDFLVHDAIAHYSAPARVAAIPADAVVLRSDSPALGSVDEFLAWRPAGRDTDPVVRLVSLFKRRLRAHPPGSEPFADADLARLRWAAGAIPGDAAKARALAALVDFHKAHAALPIAAEAAATLAELHLADNSPARAHALALAGETAFPDSVGGKQCADIRRRIELPVLTLAGERVWNAPWPRLAVTYKNTASVRFRIVKSDWLKFLGRDKGRPEWLSDAEKNEIRAAAAEREWAAALPPAKDFAERTERLPVPDDLAPGFYFLLATDGPDFSGKSAPVLYTDFWVSNLAATVAPGPGNAITGRIHDALTGEPVAGATVTAWALDRTGTRQKTGEATSDATGLYAVPGGKQYRSALLHITTPDGRSLASMSEYTGAGAPAKVNPHNRVSFFTDRAVYRPGQTLRFKGVVLRADIENDKHAPLAGRRVIVALDDANGKEVERLAVTTNDFGSFEGAFTTPRDRLTGHYQLHTVGNENGRASVLVEEYKRPTFEVALDAPAPASAADAPVRVSGKAIAYTGAPADGAKVVWRVTRTPIFPRWCWWFRPEPPVEIASGETTADAAGRFSLDFPAVLPEGKISDGVTYHYAVHADVTDSGGETRSADRVVARGRTDFTADLDASAAPGTLAVSLKTPGGDPVAGVSGKILLKKLREPAYVHRAPLREEHWRISYRRAAEAARPDDGDDAVADNPNADLSDPRRWVVGDTVATLPFTTDAAGVAKLDTAALPPGHYRAVLDAADRAGRPVAAQDLLRVLPASGDQLGLKVPFVTTADRTEAKPGEALRVTWGTGYDEGRALVEILRPGGKSETFWTEPGKTRRDIVVPLTEADRGSVAVRVAQVRENRLYQAEHTVTVPFDNKKLAVAWEKFTDKLTPGAPETWRARVTGPDGAPVAAELVATLYDASLDPFMPLAWPADFNLWRDRRPWTPLASFLNAAKPFNYSHGDRPEIKWHGVAPDPVDWKPEYQFRGYGFPGMVMACAAEGAPMMRMARGGMAKSANFAAADMAMAEAKPAPAAPSAPESVKSFPAAGAAGAPAPAADLDSLKPRKNFDETAFFFPRVTTDAAGLASFSFTTPESLTRWNCRVFAHDKDLRAGSLTASAVTALDLMVRPNAPRFLREGDAAELPVRLVNRTDKPLAGTARLALADLDTGASRDAALGNTLADQPFTLAPHSTVTLGWKLTIPDGEKFLRYTIKAVSTTGAGDGETGAIPVLPRRIQVSESVAGLVRGPGETTVTLENLKNAGASPTHRAESLTVQTVARPAWYAVQALPYLMEFPHECSEQIFHRYYANALAASITQKTPAIRDIFTRWRGTPALDSPLEKNPELQAIALAETPWVREAAGDSARRRRVALLFDDAAMKSAGRIALAKLEERRAPDGGWGWFPEARESSVWISRTVVLGVGRLRALGASSEVAVALPALPVLDRWIRKEHAEILKHKPAPDAVHLSDEIAHHLQARALFLADAPLDAPTKVATDFFLAQARAHWTTLDRASQARLALALGAYGDTATPAAIVASLRERANHNPERGMRWNDARSHRWWRPWVAPVETQALMVEVFDSVAKDRDAADACRLTLLDMKRTQDWGTTTATAEACHALLMRGDDWLAGTEPLTVTAGARPLVAPAVEPGTGATSVRLPAADIFPSLGVIKAAKSDAGPAWVSAHYSYFEDAAKVKPAAGTGLVVKQELFQKVNTVNGPELVPLADSAATVGAEVVVRVTLTADRDLDFVHLKTARPASLEPGVAVSGYKWAGALGWYESVRDTATHRFIERLPAGTHVFEFSARADRRGTCQGGITEARCLYAPEFSTHTAAPALTVK